MDRVSLSHQGDEILTPAPMWMNFEDVKLKKPNTKSLILYNSIYVKLIRDKPLHRGKADGCQSCRTERWRVTLTGHGVFFQGDQNGQS